MKHFLFVIATILLLLQVSCNTTELPPVDDIDQESSKAFGPNWFQAEVNANLHVSAPAYCFQQIKKTMPAKAWRYAVENLYYNVEVSLGADFMEKWMNSADSILQDENVHAFLLMINAEIRQFIFIKIRLESSEISDICGISINTVNQTRTRLRAKLRLQNNENLKLFVHNF